MQVIKKEPYRQVSRNAERLGRSPASSLAEVVKILERNKQAVHRALSQTVVVV
jgi:hypothetical protein